MANPTDTFPSDLDVNRLLALLNGIIPSMPSPSPSWSDYVRAQYGPDPSLVAAPASDTPGFHKSPALSGAQAPVDSGTPSFGPLPAAPPPIGPSPSFPSELPGLDKAIARINAPTPGFHLTPGLGGFTQNASGPALSPPPLPPPLLAPSGGGFDALGSALSPTMSAPSPLILANSGTAASTIGSSLGAGAGAGASAGAMTIGDTPSGADLTAASQGFQAGASYVADRLNAIVNGAYSIFPGAGNAIYEVGRGTGLLGSKEYNRSVQETSALIRAIQEMAQHPRLTFNAGKEMARTALDAEPLLPYYLAGRGLMGFATGLGYAAMPGDFLRALDRGHSALDALILRGVSGIPKP